MLWFIRIMLIRLAVITTAGAGFLYVIASVHDFPQTRQAYYDYNSDLLPLWQVIFYFVNEAGSGIRYTLTGDPKYLAYFPTSTGDYDYQDDFHALLYEANQDSWQAQLQLSHLLALGWGVEQDKMRAVQWYLRSEQTAIKKGKHASWQRSKQRKKVNSYLGTQLNSRLLQEVIQPYNRDSTDAHPDLQPLIGQRG